MFFFHLKQRFIDSKSKCFFVIPTKFFQVYQFEKTSFIVAISAPFRFLGQNTIFLKVFPKPDFSNLINQVYWLKKQTGFKNRGYQLINKIFQSKPCLFIQISNIFDKPGLLLRTFFFTPKYGLSVENHTDISILMRNQVYHFHEWKSKSTALIINSADNQQRW